MNPYKIIPYIRYSIFRQCPHSLWKIDMRTIPDHEFVFIVNGEGSILIEDQKLTAKPGKLFYFYPGLRHALESNPSNPMSFYSIHFSFTSYEYHNNQWILENAEERLPLKSYMEIGNHSRLTDLMKELNSLWNRKEMGFELSCAGLFMQLLYLVLRNYNESSSNFASRLKIDAVTKYIDENISKNISVQELSELVQLSPDYLSNIFKKHTGYSLIQYINIYRVGKAKELLMLNSRKIKDIALDLGFRDEFYFSRVFKKHEGISPMEFRGRTLVKSVHMD